MALLFEPTPAFPAMVRTWRKGVKPRATALTAQRFDPLTDARWTTFVDSHPQASVFHSSEWLEALQQTYGYKPVAYTTGAPGEGLTDAIVFCEIESWLTGRRLVSLPFSDHCDPLIDPDRAPAAIAAILRNEMEPPRWKYVELRPLQMFPLQTDLSHTGIQYAFHQLDLRPQLNEIFNTFHKSSIQRKIRRAEREGLTYQEGSNDELLDVFYRLFELTRRKHRVPPPPKKWFVNLMRCFGPALKIRVASKEAQPVAAMLTLQHKQTMVYKYGCSDVRFHNLGGMHLLFWNAIQEGKAANLSCLDFGRTDADQKGLITFKNRWGATQSRLTYSRYAASKDATHFFDLTSGSWKARTAKHVISCFPERIFSKIGQLLYGHVG